MTCDIILWRYQPAVQAFVKQQIGAAGQCLPFSESADLAACLDHLLVLGMYVVPIGTAAALAILLKQLLKAVKQIGLDSEVRKLVFALRLLTSQTGQLLACIAMEGVTINKRGVHILAHEHALKSTPDRGSTGTGRAGNGYDRILP